MDHKFSIITPAHKKTPYLKELYDSIVAQTYENWEWVLWLNNALYEEDLEEEIRNDDRVVIYRTEDSSTSVGYHKHHACLLYTSPSPRDRQKSRMPSSA